MRYFQNRVFGMEGLCNQLMALYRTISEAFMCVQQGEEACIILADGQTRNFIDLSDEDFFSPLPIEAFIEVDQFHRALAAKGVSLLRPWDVVASHEPINECSRFPISPMSPDDSRNIGIWIAESIPFAQKPLLLAQSILGWMSQHPCWAALQMRLESDVMYNQNFQYDEYVREQDRLATDSIAQFPEVSAVYVATGVNEEFLLEAMPEFRETLPGHHTNQAQFSKALAGDVGRIRVIISGRTSLSRLAGLSGRTIFRGPAHLILCVLGRIYAPLPRL